MKRLLLNTLVTASLVILMTGGVAMAQPQPNPEAGQVSQEIGVHEELLEQDAVEAELKSEMHIENDGIVHDDAHHGEGGGLPQLDPTWFASQSFWLLLMFGSLYLLFSRTVLPAISNTLENRHEHVQGDLDTAQQLKAEAESVHLAYEASLEKARTKASELYRDVEEDIKAKSEKQQAELRDRLQSETELSEARIMKSKNEAMSEMTSIAAEIASEAAKKIVGIDTDIQSAQNVVKDLNSKAKAA